jgi:MFS family permease
MKKLWTKDYILVMIYSMVAYVAHFMLVATLPLYVKEIGGNNVTAGLVMGIYSIAALAPRPFFGRVLDRKGRKPVLVLGSILFLLGIFLQNFVHSVAMVLVLRIIQGSGFSANTTAAGTMVADLTPEARLAEGMGYYGIANPLAAAIGPLVGLALVSRGDYSLLFMVSTFLILINLLVAYFINYETQPGIVSGNREQYSGTCAETARSEDVLIERGALPAAMVMFCMALAHGSILTFLPSFTILRKLPNAGNFFLVYAGAIIMTRLIAGKLADRFGTGKILPPGISLVILGLAALAYTGSPAWFWCVAVFYGLGYGMVQPLLNTAAIQMTPVTRRGGANAVFISALDIGIGLGSVLWGLLGESAGFTWVYLAAAGCVCLALLAYFLILNKRDCQVGSPSYNE